MIRIIGREIVRERSFAFPVDSPLPRVAAALPPRLRRELPEIENGPRELVFLRFFLQRRVASVFTWNDALAWDATADCRLLIRHSPTGSLHHRLNLQPTGQTSLAATPVGADDWQSGRVANGQNGQQAEKRLEHASIALPALQSGRADERIGNGESHRLPGSNLAFNPTVDESSSNGVNGELAHGYVLLAILERGSAEPHVILSADSYSLALVGRFRLLAETIAAWMGTDSEIVSAS